MKVSVFLLFAMMCTHLQAQNFGLEWSEAISVAESSFDNQRPRIALTGNGNALVIWGKVSTKEIYLSRFDGNEFSSPEALTPGGQNAYITSWTTPDIAASGDTVFVTYSTHPVLEGKIYIRRSLDGGKTFEDTIRVDDLESFIPRFPVVAIAPGGHPVVAYIKTNQASTIADYVTNRSFDGGMSFAGEVTATGNIDGEACDCCPADIVVEGQRQVLLFRNNINNVRDIWGSLSIDNGNSFSQFSNLDLSNWIVYGCPSTAPAGVFSGDSLITVWMSSGQGSARVFIGTAGKDDLTPVVNRRIFNPSGIFVQNHPAIAGKGDTMGVVWQHAVGTRVRILFSASVTGASGIGQEVDTVSIHDTGEQFNADIKYANGKFHIVYQDEITGQVMYRSAKVTAPTGVRSGREPIAFQIVPNPAKENFLIRAGSEVIRSVRVFNPAGNTLMQTGNINQSVFKVDHRLPSGVYFVEILYDTGRAVRKLIVE